LRGEAYKSEQCSLSERFARVMCHMQTDNASEATPADRRRLRVRESIISAAERVFAREGENGLSIRRLADEIDYSPSAIYKYFGSKDELIDELKEAFFERLLQKVDRSSSADRPFLQRAKACVATYVETAVTRPFHYAAAFSSIQSTVPEGCAAPLSWDGFVASQKGQAFGVLISMVTEGQELEVFDPSLDPVMAAKSIWAASHGLAQLLIHMPQFHQLVPNQQPMTATDFIEFHADLQIRGLLKPAAGTGSGRLSGQNP
jgi:AcrR family transcriptional regulator